MTTPLMLSTWSFGPVANAAGYPMLLAGADALDAAVAGATAVEDDPSVDSVGTGGYPDASGEVSLDACVMRAPDQCGAVAYVRNVPNPAQVARAVMERTTHVMLAGAGAEAFAARQGFPPGATLTPAARAAWRAWQAERAGTAGASTSAREGFVPPMNVEERYRQAQPTVGQPSRPLGSHDTVCVLARDRAGKLGGVCTTSGLAFKVPGRVGDSPIIGHGLYVDQSTGAAAATGNGELVMGVCGSFLAVEVMRRGGSPAEAVEEVLRRVASAYALLPDHQVALIALAPDGRWASGALRPGFSHCISDGGGTRTEPAQHVLLP
jgi:isoaspartyl peptidase/L-asparaginase-like protein (Ntn-hydrolase superfamily)